MKRIEDALHGYIQLSDEEVKVLDSSHMQRLRRIKQLGLSTLVYPSANHTRFEHSLGVMHFAGRLAESVDLSENQKKKVRYAGLLHDTGHGPFSHASEAVAEREGISHEDLSCEAVDSLEGFISVDVSEVKAMIRGEHDLSIVAGDIDADRLDYLLRDAHSSGLEYGLIDYETIISSAELHRGEVVFDERAVPALESLFTSRFHMIKTLYTHHTATIAEMMLQRSLEALLEDKEIDQIMKMDDYKAHNSLLNAENHAQKLYKRIKNRKLFKTALEWKEKDINKEALKLLEKRIENPRKLEKRIAEEAGIESHKVILDSPKTPQIQDISVKIKTETQVKQLQEISPIPHSLTKAEWRTVSMKVYTPEKHKEKVQKASKKVLKNYKNALQDYIE
jgi:HD superfamily phosphohydrolase